MGVKERMAAASVGLSRQFSQEPSSKIPSSVPSLEGLRQQRYSDTRTLPISVEMLIFFLTLTQISDGFFHIFHFFLLSLSRIFYHYDFDHLKKLSSRELS